VRNNLGALLSVISEGLKFPVTVHISVYVFQKQYTAEEDFRPETDDVTGEWRRLHYEELYDLYSSPDIIRVIK
jgi:hypothetical protein